jgi:hypothetical protein
MDSTLLAIAIVCVVTVLLYYGYIDVCFKKSEMEQQSSLRNSRSKFTVDDVRQVIDGIYTGGDADGAMAMAVSPTDMYEMMTPNAVARKMKSTLKTQPNHTSNFWKSGPSSGVESFDNEKVTSHSTSRSPLVEQVNIGADSMGLKHQVERSQ